MLFGLLAQQMSLVTRDQLLEATNLWIEDPSRPMGALMQELGHIGPDEAALLLEAVEMHKSPTGSDTAMERATSVDADVREALLSLRPPVEIRQWLIRLNERRVSRPAPPKAAPRGERYELGPEIARGGLGQVLEARDRDLERDVAVKLVLDDVAPEAAARFAREAKLTARLDHPAVVPIHDFGTIPGVDGKPKLFLCMKRIRGRDLSVILQGLADGNAELREKWSRARLLGVFQDICLGMAYAHSKGVIHRDLKPSNIMIGDFGETLIVDWGLAKELSEKDDGGETRRMTRVPKGATVRNARITLDGDVVGTPAYMAPEQAEGRTGQVDERSDVFALGAILYAMLTLQPPWEGETATVVLENVRAGRLAAPSTRLAASPPSASAPAAPSSRAPEPIPPELDAICLRALARRPADRYQSARDLHDEIQLFLEGAKERDRRRVAAESAVAQVREALGRRRRLREEAAKAGEEAKRLEAGTAPLADKAALWAAEDGAIGLRRQAAAAHADAVAALTRALEHDRDHKDARALMADLAWESHVEAEESGDDVAALVHRRVAEEFHDGRLDSQLRGEGTLAVRTVAFRCECLEKGRTVFPEELAAGEWHPFSGRSLAGTPGAEGLRALEPAGAARLRVHGSLCHADDLAGADVWLFRHEEVGRRLVPVTPHGLQGPGVPAAVLDKLYGKASAFRPQGPGFHLGHTPVPKRTLPMGSYLLVVAKDGRAPARVPVFVPRGGHVEQQVTLFRPAEIPAGFAPVAEGAFGYQGDRENPYAGPAETRDLPAFFLATQPVTCRDYAEFLNALPRDEAARRAPREAPDAPPLWPGPPWTWSGGRPVMNTTAAWEADGPVTAVSWEDAMAYAAWKRSREGLLVTLPTGVQWEKAARGPDRRFYPWGRHLDPRWANGEHSHEGAPRPASVTAFPGDESPYGIRGLAGNTRDACLDDAGSDWPGRRWFRGGTWARPAIEMRASDRTALNSKAVVYDFGFRVACGISLPAPDGVRGSART